MVVGLVGFECESPNKGCEALTYSFLSLLNECVADNTEVNVYVFTQFGLGLIPENYPEFKFTAIPLKIKDIKCVFLRTLLKCDVIFDVTMGDSFSDIYSLDYYNYLIKEKMYASLLAKKYILLPQTYGPFYHKESLDKAVKVMKRAYKIYCRDELSQKFLEDEAGITKSELTSDMAFMLPYSKQKYDINHNKCNVGINISGLLYKGGFDLDNQFGLKLDYKRYIHEILAFFGDNQNKYSVYFIPHVIDLREPAPDDDYKTSMQIAMIFPWVSVSPVFGTPIEAKSYIGNMDIFIGSRMHSTIAAFSSGVITIPVSYSRKFEGLYESLNYSYTIDAREEDNKSALDKLISYVENPNELKDAQSNALTTVEFKNQQLRRSIFELLEHIK